LFGRNRRLRRQHTDYFADFASCAKSSFRPGYAGA